MEDAGLQLSDGRITVRNWASACVLVREGLGVSLVPESTLPSDRQGPRAVARRPGHPSRVRPGPFPGVARIAGNSGLHAGVERCFAIE